MSTLDTTVLYSRLCEVEAELNSPTAKDVNARFRALNKLRVAMDDLRDAMNAQVAA